MDITGKIIAVLDARGGVSARTGNQWKTQEYVIETFEQFPKKCVFNVFGEDKINQWAIKVGDTLTVSFDINAREWNGRWFNDIRAWAVQRVDEQQAMANGGMPTAAPMPEAAPFPPVQNANFASAPAASPFPPAQDAAPTDDLPF